MATAELSPELRRFTLVLLQAVFREEPHPFVKKDSKIPAEISKSNPACTTCT